MKESKNFLETYGHRTIGQLISDWRESDVDPRADTWVNLPPADFLEFCRAYPRTPFDGIPPSPNHLKAPSFLVSQAHRLWMTASLVHQRVAALNASRLLDLGSFPFFTPLILRDYFGFQGDITATTNLALDKDSQSFLASRNIRVELLDLDPFVRDPDDPGEALPRTLAADDSSFDLVVCSHVVEHLYHPRAIVSESRRLLREGGEIVITTDNAMMLDVFLNYISGYGYIFEPVQQTAAMHFDFWRGHVRFFTEQDLKSMLEKCGLVPARTEFYHCFYDVLFDEYFRNPVPRLQRFRSGMLAETPWLRNDVAVIGRKAAAGEGASP